MDARVGIGQGCASGRKPDRTPGAYLVVAAGIAALVLAMGVGRFAYTALLPAMQAAEGFSRAEAGNMAAANYLGYLAGALLALVIRRRGAALRAGLAASALTTLAMGLATGVPIWSALRFLSGLASAFVFIIGYGLALRGLPEPRRLGLSGFILGGVGLGICLSALLGPAMAEAVGWREAWMGLGAASLVLAVLPWRVLRDDPGSWKAAPHATPQAADRTVSKAFAWLVAAYGLEGLGYIVSATFIPAVIRDMGGGAADSAGAWLLVGLAAAPSAVLWGRIGQRFGALRALMAAYLVQAVGILLPVTAGKLGAYFGAAMFGGTFMGIVTLATTRGVALGGGRAVRVVAIMTSVYGLGQVLGPWAAGLLAASAGDYAYPLPFAAGAVLLGAVLLPRVMVLENKRKGEEPCRT